MDQGRPSDVLPVVCYGIEDQTPRQTSVFGPKQFTTADIENGSSENS
jgi:hypothetical protein